MASKPEANFRNSCHKHLPKELYKVGMANSYAGGIPDVYYDGPKSDFWIEWKYIEKLPPTLCLANPKAKTKLSKLQDQWLTRRYNNGRNLNEPLSRSNCAVALGVGKGKDAYVVLFFRPEEWHAINTREELQAWGMSRSQFADWLMTETVGPNWYETVKAIP